MPLVFADYEPNYIDQPNSTEPSKQQIKALIQSTKHSGIKLIRNIIDQEIRKLKHVLGKLADDLEYDDILKKSDLPDNQYKQYTYSWLIRLPDNQELTVPIIEWFHNPIDSVSNEKVEQLINTVIDSIKDWPDRTIARFKKEYLFRTYKHSKFYVTLYKDTYSLFGELVKPYIDRNAKTNNTILIHKNVLSILTSLAIIVNSIENLAIGIGTITGQKVSDHLMQVISDIVYSNLYLQLSYNGVFVLENLLNLLYHSFHIQLYLELVNLHKYIDIVMLVNDKRIKFNKYIGKIQILASISM